MNSAASSEQHYDPLYVKESNQKRQEKKKQYRVQYCVHDVRNTNVGQHNSITKNSYK